MGGHLLQRGRIIFATVVASWFPQRTPLISEAKSNGLGIRPASADVTLTSLAAMK